MLQEVGEQQEVVFRMAFKMHNTTNYEIVTSESVDQPDLILVDTDTEKGIEVWKTLKKNIRQCRLLCFPVLSQCNNSLSPKTD